VVVVAGLAIWLGSVAPRRDEPVTPGRHQQGDLVKTTGPDGNSSNAEWRHPFHPGGVSRDLRPAETRASLSDGAA
jgi:hypothetical protein